MSRREALKVLQVQPSDLISEITRRHRMLARNRQPEKGSDRYRFFIKEGEYIFKSMANAHIIQCNEGD